MADAGKYGKVEIRGVPGDEPVFIIRAQDVVAVQAIVCYQQLAEVVGANPDHISNLTYTTEEFLRWSLMHETKVPD